MSRPIRPLVPRGRDTVTRWAAVTHSPFQSALLLERNALFCLDSYRSGGSVHVQSTSSAPPPPPATPLTSPIGAESIIVATEVGDGSGLQ